MTWFPSVNVFKSSPSGVVFVWKIVEPHELVDVRLQALIAAPRMVCVQERFLRTNAPSTGRVLFGHATLPCSAIDGTMRNLFAYSTFYTSSARQTLTNLKSQ